MKNANSSSHLQVVIVIPVYKDFNELSNNEIRALSQVKNILGNRAICLIHPPSVPIEQYCEMFLPLAVDTLIFDSKYFGSCLRSNRLLLTEHFYQSFSKYEYLLIHQLDSYVFSDQLDYWCNQNIDFIGAPWLLETSPYHDLKFLGVGNGGFSLRKVSSFLAVLKRRNFVYFHTKLFLEEALHRASHLKLAKNVRINNFLKFMEYYVRNEDGFWGLVVPRYFKWFVVAKPQQALQFSFEKMPTRLFKMNNEVLPFGCHAWERYELAFYRPYIRFDESMPADTTSYIDTTLAAES